MMRLPKPVTGLNLDIPDPPTREEFRMLLQEFVDDFTNGRYDTINKMVLIDEVTNRHTHLLSLKEVLLQEILSSPVRCSTTTLNKYQLYSNSYSPADFLPRDNATSAPQPPSAPKTKRKRISSAAPCRTAAPPCKRRRINSVCVAVSNKKSVFYKC